MNRSALKLPCAVLFGMALGWGMRGQPQRSKRTDAANGGSSGTAVQSGSSAAHGGSPQGGAGAGKSAGRPGAGRLEMLVARFRDRTDDEGETSRMSLMMDIAELSGDEFGPLMALLEKGKPNDGVMESLAVRWGMLDPKAALAFTIEREGLGDDPDVMSSIVGELAKVDLPAAKNALGDLNEAVREDAGISIVRQLLHKDPRAALAYARELKDDDAEAEVLTSMARTDPLAAAAELTLGKNEQIHVTALIAASLMERDQAAFEAWMGSLTDPEQRVTAFLGALDERFHPDPKSAALEAAAWLSGEPGGRTEMAEVLAGGIAGRWLEAKGPPAEVAAWTATLPEGRARDSAVLATGRAWLAQDVTAASAWLASLPQSQGKDGAVLRLVETIRDEAPADAFAWARAMETPAMRSSALFETVRSWAAMDPDSAGAAVATLPAGDRMNLWNVLEAAKEKAAEQK